MKTNFLLCLDPNRQFATLVPPVIITLVILVIHDHTLVRAIARKAEDPLR